NCRTKHLSQFKLHPLIAIFQTLDLLFPCVPRQTLTFVLLLCRFNFTQSIPVPKMAAVSSKVVQHVLVAHCCQQDRQLSTQYQKDCCTPNRLNLLPHIRRKLAWTQISTMQLHTFSKFNRGIVYCNAAAYATILQPVDRSAFLKLQNGSDIRGVAIDGVEGEPINLTEPVTEAIAAAFVEWLLNKKKPAASRQLKVSIGHDSRISAQKLQDAVSRGLAGAGVEVIQYGYVKLPLLCHLSSFCISDTEQKEIIQSPLQRSRKCDEDELLFPLSHLFNIELMLSYT
ncbi:phosphoglucosamine mutase, partial [Striga asiatica]